MTFAEYLKQHGATDEDIKILDTPVARKAFEARENELATTKATAEAHAKDVEAHRKWYNEVGLPYATRMKQERDAAIAKAAAETARSKALQEAGLIELAEAADPGSTAPKPGETPAFDPNKYVPVEAFQELAIRARDASVMVADLAQEHTDLGLPRVSWAQLRKEADEAKQPINTYWENKFGIAAKRGEKAAADKAAYEKKIAEEAVAKYKSEMGNPLTTTALPSRTPFTGKVPSASDAQTPWIKSESERQNDRVSRLAQKHPDLLN